MSTGQGILGNNMFAYCNNNPVIFVDIAGCIPSRWNYELKNPFVEQNYNDIEPNITGTVSFGIAIFGSPEIWAYGIQACLSTDMYGNTEFQITAETGPTTGSGVSFMPYIMGTNAPHVSNLRGDGTAIGVVLPTTPAAIALDYNFIPNPVNDTVYEGFTLSMGMGTPEVHAM